MDLASKLDAMERALMRMGIRVLEEELPEEAQIDGGLCRVAGELVLYVSPTAPPWRRAMVLQQALRRLPHRDIWLPPELRRLLADEDFGEDADGLLQLKQDEEEA
ncbi:MAG TPA: hypothetical protein VLS88_09105 [Polyangiales bacterium]|nr:hypothetical protein [Polyangiales bacterium]